MRPSRHGAKGLAAMTLLEVLVAVALAGMVAVVVFSLYHTVAQTVLGRAGRRVLPDQAAAALESLRRDLIAVFLSGEKDCAFQLKVEGASDAPYSSLELCTLALGPGGTDLRWAETLRVRYRVEPGDRGPPVLLRIHQPLVGPGALAGPVTNILAGGVERFDVRVHDGVEWRTDWSKTEPGARPGLASIDLTLSRGGRRQSLRTAVAIPVGRAFTSRLERARSEP